MFFKKGKQKIGGIVKWFPREVVFSRHPATIKGRAMSTWCWPACRG